MIGRKITPFDLIKLNDDEMKVEVVSAIEGLKVSIV